MRPGKLPATAAAGGTTRRWRSTGRCRTLSSTSWESQRLPANLNQPIKPPGADPHAGWCGRGRGGLTFAPLCRFWAARLNIIRRHAVMSAIALNGQTNHVRVCLLLDHSGQWSILAGGGLSANDVVDGAYSAASKCDRLVALKAYRNVEGDDGLMRTGWTGDRENPLMGQALLSAG